ncbi:hypothetical protein LTS10_005895 [Elasticomyces elasticus]|nr:hypothetical protein LTS10_005895 [Elasticomyces elasticus]
MTSFRQQPRQPNHLHYDVPTPEQRPFEIPLSASTRVFAIFELLEMILLHFKDSLQLFALQDVNYAFRFIIRSSKALAWWPAETEKSHWWEKRLDYRLEKASELSCETEVHLIRPGWIYDGPIRARRELTLHDHS